MKKFLAAVLISATIMPSVAHADWNGHHHGWGGPRPGYYHGGGGGDWAGPLIGGLLIGGMLGAMANQPSYNQPYYNQPYYAPQTFCRMEPAYDQYGNFVGKVRRCWQQ